MDIDMEAQTENPSRRASWYNYTMSYSARIGNDKADWPWWLIPQVEAKRRRLSSRVDSMLKHMVRNKCAEQQTSLLDETCDQIKTFLVAGHDTTSITIAWVFYFLSRTQHALTPVRKELGDLLGPKIDPESVRLRLLLPDGPEILRKMTYISAVIKETLRLFTPDATAHYVKPRTGFTIETPGGEKHCLDEMIIHNAESYIQRDPVIYGDTAQSFDPERWLDEKSSEIPVGSWRPFECGPRGCIGQELALIELRAIMAMTARHFECVKVGLGEPALNEKNEPDMDENGIFTSNRSFTTHAK
ncbi:sterigmatocystin biosynthesis P450 monooxygenase stcS [Paramyrothecium foliicola]|nr:sterigmatocystin biosynthesis P450 monooxygenase stcS [Paramyrothecium foliicola]